jgi:ribosomal protein S18 acetylase RimI-like enzyme
MSISVRRARDDDRSFIETLGIETALQTVSPVRALNQKVAEHAYHRLMKLCEERPGTVIFLAENQERRAGFLVMLTDMPDDITQNDQAFIAYVAVVPEQRGRGVGRALLQAAIAEGLRRELPHLSLMVSAENAEAKALYESENFVPERILMTRPLASVSAS